MRKRTPHGESGIENRLRAILNATTIRSPSLFLFNAREYSVPQHGDDVNVEGSDGSALVALLTQTLYERCYCARFEAKPAPAAELQRSTITGDDNDALAQFQRSLSEANAGQDCWTEGWKVRSVMHNGSVMATKGPWLRAFQAGEYLIVGGSYTGPYAGASLRVFCARESWTAQVGYYYAFGASITDALDEIDIVRLYFNVRHNAVTTLVRCLTSALNRYCIPYKFKCPIYPQSYSRVDGTVLFIGRRYYRVTIEAIAELFPCIADALVDDVPLFTRRLRAGLSVAEDPGNGASFGVHRMGLVAGAIWSAWANGQSDLDDRLNAVEAAFIAAGLSLSSPHTNGSTAEPYIFPEA